MLYLKAESQIFSHQSLKEFMPRMNLKMGFYTKTSTCLALVCLFGITLASPSKDAFPKSVNEYEEAVSENFMPLDPVQVLSNEISVPEVKKNPTFKPGHDMIKEFHFHVYWYTNNMEQSKHY